MKFYNQHGAGLQRTNLHESDNVCDCCQSFDHAATEWFHDDVMCAKCHSLCRCGCHRSPDERRKHSAQTGDGEV